MSRSTFLEVSLASRCFFIWLGIILLGMNLLALNRKHRYNRSALTSEEDEYKTMKLRIILLVVASALLASCSKNVTVSDPGAAFKGQSAKKIYTTGRKALFQEEYDVCTKQFEGLEALYPFGKYSYYSQLDIIYCYYKQDDVGMTLASADRYIQLYPGSPYVPYAYYMRGLSEFYQGRNFLDNHYPTDYSQRDLEPLRKAFVDFDRVVRDYPHSKYAPDARRRMIYIRNLMALHNLEVAQFYFNHRSYVGAANRANDVVKHYQGSAAIPGALIMMTQSYQQLHLPLDALQSLTVLKLN